MDSTCTEKVCTRKKLEISNSVVHLCCSYLGMLAAISKVSNVFIILIKLFFLKSWSWIVRFYSLNAIECWQCSIVCKEIHFIYILSIYVYALPLQWCGCGIWSSLQQLNTLLLLFILYRIICRINIQDYLGHRLRSCIAVSCMSLCTCSTFSGLCGIKESWGFGWRDPSECLYHWF